MGLIPVDPTTHTGDGTVQRGGLDPPAFTAEASPSTAKTAICFLQLQ